MNDHLVTTDAMGLYESASDQVEHPHWIASMAALVSPRREGFLGAMIDLDSGSHLIQVGRPPHGQPGRPWGYPHLPH